MDMKLCVLMSGVLDPKWSLPQGVDYVHDFRALDKVPRKLSPFDEAALEVALKLRDAAPSIILSVYMPDGPGADSLLRVIAAHKPDHVALLPIDESARWDPAAFARIAAAYIGANSAAGSLWVIGREFGDLDEGAFGAFLAHAGNAGLIERAEEIKLDGAGALYAARTRSTVTERIRVPAACVVTVTNAKSNRLRHPLMKNVMLAKRMTIPRLDCAEAPAPEPRVKASRLLDIPRDVQLKPPPMTAAAGMQAQVDAVFQLLDAAYPS
jgi:electron transfer flavoprotein beta subunit